MRTVGKRASLNNFLLPQNLTNELQNPQTLGTPIQHALKVKGHDGGDSFEGTGCIVLPRA